MWEQVSDWVLRGIYVPYSAGKPYGRLSPVIKLPYHFEVAK